MAIKFLVTGATGFIGRRLCEHIVDRGDTAIAAVRPTSPRHVLAGIGAQLAEVDLRTGDGLREALSDVDCVMHLADVVKASDLAAFRAGNVATTRLLAQTLAGLAHPPRLVVCSSLAAAGPAAAGIPRAEADPVRPVSWYGRSKLAAEQAARVHSDRVPTVLVRPAIVYGPGDPAFLPSLLAMMRFGVVLKSGSGQRAYSLIHVDDLCRVLLAAAERGRTVRTVDSASGVYFASDGFPYSWDDLCGAVASASSHAQPRTVSLPVAVVRAAAAISGIVGRARGEVSFFNTDKVRELRCADWTCASDKAHRELGFVPEVSLSDGLATVLGTATPVPPHQRR
ncbi:NAD-dependent epimerase/dehydratase family protein [Saccharopolyspora sp. 5N708]|uniref:NAD-dependent epimerase/dehydratase family protein n=1 Tax=Saccharopolyspora sp. 5N708 TaxID=3457424 RepID=UPI003FD07D34